MAVPVRRLLRQAVRPHPPPGDQQAAQCGQAVCAPAVHGRHLVGRAVRHTPDRRRHHLFRAYLHQDPVPGGPLSSAAYFKVNMQAVVAMQIEQQTALLLCGAACMYTCPPIFCKPLLSTHPSCAYFQFQMPLRCTEACLVCRKWRRTWAWPS